ncbi:hypothetical protein LguiB_013704 [Lonicera macranthoides]
MGFGDAFSLSRVIADGIAVGSDIGEENGQRCDDGNTGRVPKAYSVDFGLLNVLRATAFHGEKYIAPLKRDIISYASGEQTIPLLS